MAILSDIDPKVWDRVLRMRGAGDSIKTIIEATGLNYSQVWNFIRHHELEPKLRVSDKNKTPATVKALRDEGNSWGEIMVRFGYPADQQWTEGKIRSLYEEATGIKSEGTRIGRGGRFLADERDLYGGVRQKGGIEIERPVTRTQVLALAKKLDPNATRIKADGAVLKSAGKVKQVAKQGGVVKTAAKKAPAKKVTAKKVAAKKAAAKAKIQADVEIGEDPFAKAS